MNGGGGGRLRGINDFQARKSSVTLRKERNAEERRNRCPALGIIGCQRNFSSVEGFLQGGSCP